jgi:hypothetical protein
MKKLTEKIQSKLDAIKDALYHRFVRPLREDIVRRGGDTVARGLDLSATEVAQHLSIDAFDVAQEINKSEIASHIDVEEIASYVEVGAEDVAQEISPHEIASELACRPHRRRRRISAGDRKAPRSSRGAG